MKKYLFFTVIILLFLQGCFESTKRETLNLAYTLPKGWERFSGMHGSMVNLLPKSSTDKIRANITVTLNRISIEDYCKVQQCTKQDSVYTFDDFMKTEYAWHNEKNIGTKLEKRIPTEETMLSLPARGFEYTYVGADGYKNCSKKIYVLHRRHIYELAYYSFCEFKDRYIQEFVVIKDSMKILDKTKD